MTETATSDEAVDDAAQTDAPPAGADGQAPDQAAQDAAGADDSVEVHDAELPEATDAPGAAGGGQIDILLDTTMPVTVRLGQSELEVRELLQLGPGSVVTLDREVGQPVDLLLRGIRFATGHLVVVGERLGVRVHEILRAAPANEGDAGADAAESSAAAPNAG